METGGNKTVSRLSRNASRFKSQNNSTFTHNIETFLRNKFPPALSLNTQDCQFIQNIFFLSQVLIYVLYSYFEPLLYLKYMKMSIESFSQSFWFLAFVKFLVRCSTCNQKNGNGIKEQLAINFGKYLFSPETPFRWKKVFFMTLRSIFKVFRVETLCSVRKRFLYVCYISSLFPLQVFTLFVNLLSYVQNSACKGPNSGVGCMNSKVREI